MKALCSAFVVCLFWVGAALGQGAGEYVYVHKTLRDLSEPPWLCVCYSVSRQSPIVSNLAQSQTWPVSRYNTWGDAVAARNALTASPNVCTTCDQPMAGGTPGGGGGGSGGGVTTTGGAGLTLFVFGNCTGADCILGVADEGYSQAGWSTISPPFRNRDEAWRYACALHQQGPYRSPDIERGNVSCAALSQDRENVAEPALDRIFSSTYGDIHWQEGYYSSTSKTLAVDRVFWQTALGVYVVRGRWGRSNGSRSGEFEFHFDAACSFSGYWWDDGEEMPSGKNWSGSCKGS